MKMPPCCPLRPYPLSLLFFRQPIILFPVARSLSASSHSFVISGHGTCGCGTQTDPVVESSSHYSSPKPLLTQTRRERTVSQVMPGVEPLTGWVEPVSLGSKVNSNTYSLGPWVKSLLPPGLLSIQP